MNIDEFIASLPSSITSGHNPQLPDNVIRKFLGLAELGRKDNFCHIYCGDGRTVEIAATEFGVRESVGVEPDETLAHAAAGRCKNLNNAKIVNSDLSGFDLGSSTAVLVWYAQEDMAEIVERKIKKEMQDNGRVITIWSPFAMTIPDKIDFPFFVTKKPFRKAKSIRDQIEVIYGNRCIDFTAAWLLAERYIDQLEIVQPDYRRFVTILQCLVIWANAWKMHVACEEEIPPPVDTYIGIMKTFFGVDLSSLLEKPN